VRYYERETLYPTDLPKDREEFLASLAEPAGTEIGRLELISLTTEAAIPDTVKPILSLDFLHIQAIQLPQEERFQPVIDSSGDAQAYFFGRNMRVYQVSAFMIDTNLTLAQQGAVRGLAGHLLSRWKRVYETLRAPRLVKLRRILRLVWGHSESFGYILGHSPNLTAEQPHMCSIGLVFSSVCDRERVVVPRISAGGDNVLVGLVNQRTANRLMPEMFRAVRRMKMGVLATSLVARTPIVPSW
jgi:hypothetical protein